jgi:hypothetical protein
MIFSARISMNTEIRVTKATGDAKLSLSLTHTHSRGELAIHVILLGCCKKNTRGKIQLNKYYVQAHTKKIICTCKI